MRGFDTSARMDAETGQTLMDLGYRFAVRYLVPSRYSKALTADEVTALSAVGLRIGCVWETTASRASHGASAGLSDGQEAKKLAVDLGVPEDAVIYFAVDYNAPKTDYYKIAAYLISAAAKIRPYRVGVYGSFAVVEEMHRLGVAEAFWQCVAWSDGKISEHANIYQKNGNVATTVGTIDVNYCADMDKAGLWVKKEEPMLYAFSPVGMGIYTNRNKKRIKDIRKELNCDVICNLNLFNGDWTGACYTRADGEVVGTDGYGYYGFGFDYKDHGFTRAWSYADKHRNFFGCWDVMRNGKPYVSPVPAWTSGYRRRTVIGMLSDGRVGIYCNTTAETPADMWANLEKAGFTEAICVDGGGSTQMITPIGEVVSSDPTPRKVHTLFWGNLTDKTNACPYAEPTKIIRFGSVGEGAKWFQWKLNRYGYGLSVDGIFGVKSSKALKDFQSKHGLVVDGLGGEKTRAELNKQR